MSAPRERAPLGKAPLDGAFPALKRLVIARTGHAYYEDKDGALWERLRRRIRATGTGDSAGYLALLEADEGEWAVLESEVTIGETFFFRDAAQFEALREVILPGLIRRRAAERRLRIWSAGCSTGAEAYSVSILLRRLLGPAYPQWAIGILGTDISEAALEAARAARFSPWALRGMPAVERERDFLAMEEGRAFQLRREHRSGVRFEYGNLLSLLDGTMPLGMSDYDLILCRNVLIYFDRAAVPSIVRALGERMAPHGWMLLGHSEPDPSFGSFLQPVSLPGTTAWRPLPLLLGKLPEPPPSPAAPAAAETAPLQQAPEEESKMPTEPDSPPEGGTPRLAADRARAEADAGALEAARATLRAGLRDHPMNAALHHLDGLVARGMGEDTAAEAALRRAVYLDSGFVAAHYHLGLLLLDRGAVEAGRRSIANAARLARALPGETILEEGDGMTAETLLGLAGQHLAEGRG
ncbi:CheR family methyltransferase [Muricoccus aerilatus]|uniref:CheR family methyltransferase n=1 Tax=Muricoccus aerilatus TaxID=452982 RepID=UPI0006946AF1|nr:protein-glutamate O-methyltransferase CheR [Roseomonas aerilata]